MKKIILSLFLANVLFAKNSVDCIILEDEDSIVCKYSQIRVNYDKNVTFEWVEPNGIVSRTKNFIIKAKYGSVYDYRYIKGRTRGEWTLRVIDKDKTYETTFELKK